MASAPIPLEKPPVTDFYVLLGVSCFSAVPCNARMIRYFFRGWFCTCTSLLYFMRDFLFPISFSFSCFFSLPKSSPPLPLELGSEETQRSSKQCKQDLCCLLLLSFAKLVVMEFWPFLKESVQRYGGYNYCCVVFLRFAGLLGMVSCERTSLVLVLLVIGKVSCYSQVYSTWGSMRQAHRCCMW